MKDPVKFHAPAPFQKTGNGIIPLKTSSSRTYTDAVSDALFKACGRDPKVAVITAAMCEGNKLQKIRETFPDQFFDVGICESHAVAFAAGMAKTGGRPVVDIYSTFLQRSYDQIFQEVALQDLPVVFCLDRAGLVGADGPTHHGVLRPGLYASLPQHGGHGPRRRRGHRPDVRHSPSSTPQPVAIRYPRANLDTIEREVQPDRAGPGRDPRVGDRRHVPRLRHDGRRPVCKRPITCVTSTACVSAWSTPGSSSRLDQHTVCKAIEECGFVLTVEEGCLMGGFGSAVLEAANDAGLSTTHLRRLGLPDRYVLHAEREEQLAEVGLDVEGITQAAMDLSQDRRTCLCPRARPECKPALSPDDRP